MSVDQFIQLMVEDPELRQRLLDAGSNDERAAMVAEFSIEIPTEAQVTARIAELQEMRDVDGGSSWESSDNSSAAASAANAAAPH